MTPEARIVIPAKDNTQAAIAKARAGFASLSREAGGIQTAFSGLGAAITGALAGTAIPLFFKSVIDGVDAFNDLADATGSSVEKLSGLEDVAARTGASFETVGQALTRFNKTHADGKPGSDQARILESIGLSARELRKIDPADALQKTAQALARYADDGNKARITQELFGKSLREVAPFLKDLAAAGELNGKVTTTQAQAAEQFNNQLAELAKNSKDAARAIAADLVPVLNRVLEDIKKNGGVFNQFLAGARLDGLSRQRKELENLNLEIARTSSQLDQFTEAQQKEPGNRAYSERVNELRADLERLTKQAAEASEALKKSANVLAPLAVGRRPANEGGGRFVPQSAPELPDKPKAEKKAPRFDVAENAGLSAALRAIEQTDTAKLSALQDQLAELLTLRRETRGEPAVVTAINETIEAIDKLKAARLGPATLDPQEIQKMNFLRSEKEAYEQITEKITEMDEFAQQAARNIQDTLGTGLRQILGGNFRDIGQLFKNMLLDMVAQATAARIGKALFGDLLSGGSGNGSLFAGFLKFFGSANGNAFDTGGVVKFASGGVVSSATPFAFGGGRLGVMGEAGPEAVMPLKRGRDGKLGVAGGGFTQNLQIRIDSRTDQAQVQSLVAQGVAAGNRELIAQLRAAGAV